MVHGAMRPELIRSLTVKCVRNCLSNGGIELQQRYSIVYRT